VITEVMFLLDVVGRFAAQDVAREVQSLLEGKVTIVEPKPCLIDLDAEHLVPHTIL
jgi:hypothetical protein